MRDLSAGVVTGLCIAPSAAINIAPHLEHATRDPQSFGIALVQAVMVVVMARLPFSLKNSTAVTEKLVCLMFMGAIFCVSFFNALDLASAARESATGVARGTISRAAGLNSRLVEIRKSRSEVPQFKFTSAAAATAAKTAADEAVIARDKECAGRVGDKCRKRTDEARDAQTVLAGILEQRELTEKAEALDGEVARIQRDLRDLGPIPARADSTASKVTRLVGLFVKANDDDIAEWRPIIFAFVVELLALLGPFFMLKRAVESTVPKTQQHAILWKRKDRKAGDRNETAAPSPAGVGLTPATPAKAEKVKRIKRAAVAGVGDVREWYNSRTAARLGNLVRVNECYADYLGWCKARGLEAYSLTKFGTKMRDVILVEKIEKSKRSYYAGFALKPMALKVVAA